MRTIVRASTKKKCETRVAQMEGQGWTKLMEVKEDVAYHPVEQSFVCVMERKDKKQDKVRKNGLYYGW